MELKKSPRVDLVRFRNLFIQIGFVLALGICLLAFELKTEIRQAELGGITVIEEIDTEIIPITRQKLVKPPEPPPPPKVVEVLNIVDDDVEIDEELEIEDTEANEETIIDITPVTNIKNEKEDLEETVFFIVEEMPEFPGGELALRKFISNSIKYPIIAQENGIEGKVFVNFVINQHGKVTNVRIIRSVDQSLDNEALRVVNNLPKWKPGKQRGIPVKVSYCVPISFVLQK